MFESVKQRWSEISTTGKIIFITLLSLLLAALVYSLIWAFKEDYQVLFSDLNPQDASAMVAELDHLKTPYKLSDNGTTILVESESVYKTRLKLIGKGLNLNGSVGFELFNNSEFGMTEFAQKVNYLRALQGELERTIAGFDEIKLARVHLVLPESSLFKRKQAKPKASVMIVMKNGLVLMPEQISGIQKLVSASVPEVMPGEVTIVDQKGVALTRNILGNSEESNLYERLDVKKQIESYVTAKIVNVLDRVVGNGKAIVSVDISLNYDQIKVTKEDVVPLPNTYGQSVGAIARKRMTNQVDEPSGQSTTSFTEDQTANNQNAPASASTSEVEYLNNKRVEQVLSAAGTINKLSVGVVIPDISDPIKLAKIKEIVSVTAGINLRRGDGLVVHNIEIPVSGEDVETSQMEWSSNEPTPTNINIPKKEKFELPKYALELLIGAFVLLAAILIALNLRKKNNNSSLNKQDREKLLSEINEWASSQSVKNI